VDRAGAEVVTQPAEQRGAPGLLHVHEEEARRLLRHPQPGHRPGDAWLAEARVGGGPPGRARRHRGSGLAVRASSAGDGSSPRRRAQSSLANRYSSTSSALSRAIRARKLSSTSNDRVRLAKRGCPRSQPYRRSSSSHSSSKCSWKPQTSIRSTRLRLALSRCVASKSTAVRAPSVISSVVS